MSRYPEFDPSGIQPRPARDRATKVGVPGLAGRVEPADASLIDRLPDILAGTSLRSVISAAGRAAREGRPIILMFGAHVVKTGCSPVLIQLMETGVIRGIAMNGAAAIHDFELAIFGSTSEDVESTLGAGTFGMSQETAVTMNAVTVEARDLGLGLGEALGRHLETAPNAAVSILACASRLTIPATVHVALGTDVIHQHPSTNGAAIGETSLRDFRILTRAMSPLSGGVVFNFGSAVIMPEVFLKALSMILNTGEDVYDLTTCDLDFVRHYRPMQNVVHRPTAGGRGTGYSITGHHEILIPLLVAGILRNLSSS